MSVQFLGQCVIYYNNLIVLINHFKINCLFIIGTPMVLESQIESDELMPPTMFIMDELEDELVTSSVNAIALTEPKHMEPATNRLEPLTKNQLLQAFEYLLKNDPEFMVKIHEAYVKSLLRN